MDGGGREISAPKVIVTAGGRSAMPDIPGTADVPTLDCTQPSRSPRSAPPTIPEEAEPSGQCRPRSRSARSCRSAPVPEPHPDAPASASVPAVLLEDRPLPKLRRTRPALLDRTGALANDRSAEPGCRGSWPCRSHSRSPRPLRRSPASHRRSIDDGGLFIRIHGPASSTAAVISAGSG